MLKEYMKAQVIGDDDHPDSCYDSYGLHCPVSVFNYFRNLEDDLEDDKEEREDDEHYDESTTNTVIKSLHRQHNDNDDDDDNDHQHHHDFGFHP